MAALVVAVAASCTNSDETGGSAQVRLVVGDLLNSSEHWNVLNEREEGSVRGGTVSPALHFSMDGSGMPTLIMPPPAEVELQFDLSLLPSELQLRSGIDVSCLRYLSDDVDEINIRFTVVQNGVVVFETTNKLEEPSGGPVGSAWADLRSPLIVSPGDTIKLATECVDSEGNSLECPVELLAGFGGLTLERSREVRRTRASAKAPNIIVVVMDTLRNDKLSTAGHTGQLTPNLERLAKRGVSFSEAYSTASWTWPATASLHTGLLPGAHGVVDKTQCYLDHELETMAELFLSEGFHTAGWSGNPLISRDRNFTQGFERFNSSGEFRKTDTFWNDVETWLHETAEERFFLYLHLADPHEPYLPHASDQDKHKALLAATGGGHFSDAMKTVRAWRSSEGASGQAPEAAFPPNIVAALDSLYEASVASGDYWLGRLLDALAELELEENTIVVFTSDHGEELFERGTFGHGQSLHDELVHVPLVFAGPRLGRGLSMDGAMSTRLVPGTVLSLAGVPMGDDLRRANMRLGESGALVAPRDDVLFETRIGVWNDERRLSIFGIRRGDLALHWKPENASLEWPDTVPPSSVHLYDLRQDPLELRDCASQRPRDVQDLGQSLAEQLQEAALRKRGGSGGAAGLATETMLRKLGYLGDK